MGRVLHCWRGCSPLPPSDSDQAFTASSSQLPIYIEDSHAGSFYFLAEHLDLDLPHTDSSCSMRDSDASPIFDSDAIRAAIRSSDGSPANKETYFGAGENPGRSNVTTGSSR